MKKLLFSLLVLLFAMQSQAQNVQVIVGNGTGSINFCNIPGYFGFHNSAMLFTPSDLQNMWGEIQNLAFDVSAANSTSTRAMKIYLKEVADTSLPVSMHMSDFLNGATLVYDQINVAVTSIGWNTFSFTAPFTYTGTSNLLVIVTGTGCTTSGDCSVSQRHTTATGMAWMSFSDGENIDFDTEPGNSTYSNLRFNTRFTITPDPDLCFAPTTPLSSNILPYTATISWAHHSLGMATGEWEVQYKPASESNWANATVLSVTDTFADLSNLTSATTYNWRVKTICDEGSNEGTDFSPWINGNFTTAISCPAPTGIHVPSETITTEEATVVWNPTTGVTGAAQEYIIQWKSGAISSWDDPAVGLGNTIDTFFNVQNLTASTLYNVRVRAVCNVGDDNSVWTTVNFYSVCDVITQFPWNEGFEATWTPATGVGNRVAPNCWTVVNLGAGSSNYWQRSTSYTHSGSAAAACNTDNDNNNNNDWLITPLISLTGNERLRFWYQNHNSTTDEFDCISVFISDENITLDTLGMAPFNDMTGFTQIWNLDPIPTGPYTRKEINLSQYTGNRYIAFVRKTNRNGWYLRVDDVEISELPQCLSAINPTAGNVQATEATISWTKGSETDANWLLLYKTASATTYDTLHITENPYLLQNLAPTTTYNVIIVTDCEGADNAEPSLVLTFKTACLPVSSFSWSESFDTYGTGASIFPICWERYNNGTVSTNYPYIIGNHTHSAPGSIYFSSSNSLTLVSPMFDVDINNLKLTFWLRREGTNSGTFSVGYLATPANPTSFVALITYNDTNATWIEHKIGLEEVPAGIKQFAFRQNQISSSYYYWLDDITISNCTPPTNIHIENLTPTSADIAWSDLAQITDWTLKVSPTPLADPTTEYGDAFDGSVSGTPTQNVGSLTAATLYHIYVQNSCDTNWATSTFTTPATCAFPTGLTATATSITTATLTWNALGMTDWNLKVSSTALTDPDNESGNVFDGQVSGISSQNITDLTLDTTYYWYVQSDCGSAWANGTFAVQYCTPNPISIDFSGGIRHVTFGILPMVNYATTPPSSAPFYNNNSNLIGGVVEGETSFPISVTQGYSGGYITKIWVDWNHDLIFDNVTELVAGPSADVTGIQNFTATIPANTPLGSYRLRIGSHDRPNNGALIPCYEGVYGSYEDYTLEIVPVPPCPYPADLSVNGITSSSATATWTTPVMVPANGYQILVSTSATEPTGSEPEIQTTTNNSLIINNLYPITSYYVWIRSYCGNDNYSVWTSVNFTTSCAIATLPYTQNFDASINIPSCWNTFGEFSVVANHSTSSPNTLRFDGQGTNVAVLPVFNVDVNTAKISFVLRRESLNPDYNSGTMDIGYLTNMSDENSFVAVMTDILLTEDINTPFDTALSAFPAGVKNIAFRQTTTSYLWYYWLDNIFVYNPNCMPVSDFAIQNLTATSANISWNDDNSPSTSWNVEVYSTAQYNPTVGGGNVVTTTESNTATNITTLEPNTTYYLYVKNDCNWSNYSFTTPCAATTIPYTQNFDANANLPACWIMYGSLGISTSYSTSSPNTLRFNGNGTNVAVLPIFDEDVDTTKISFVLRREDASSGAMDIGYLTDISDANSFVAVITDILTAEDDNTAFNTALSAFPAGITHIAFRQITTTNHWYWLDDVNVYFAPPITCSAPTALNHTTLAHDAATVTWTVGDTESEWQVAWKESTASNWNYEITTAIAYDISGLTATTNYNVKVRAICGEADTSDWTATYHFTTLATPCAIPTEVAAVAVFDAAIVTWTENGSATQWEVAWREATASNWNYDIATATTYGISGLAAATNYEVKVRAICGAATSDWSDAATFTTLACNKPANVEITEITATTITLTWEATNGETKWSVIWRSTTAGSGSAIVENTPTTILTELTPATDYEICVVAICMEGVEGGESAEECKPASTTAIHDLTLANSLQLYPNPTTGELRIKNYELQEGDKIEVYNMLGQKQQLTTDHYQLTTINVSHLSAGVYTVKIGGYVGKFVKK